MGGVLLLVSLILLVNTSFAAETCGSSGRSCVKEAKCENGKCVCQAPYVRGDGAFACYTQTELSAEISNDPILSNFNNESLPFPFPCRYLATHVLTKLHNQAGNIIGMCEFMIHSFNAKSRGKFFLHGFDVALKIRYDSGLTLKFSSRHYGLSKFGVSKIKSSATVGEFFQNGPWGSDALSYVDKVNDIKLSTNADQATNHFLYAVKGCGVRITFVPYDIKRRRAQEEIPGLAIAVDKLHDPKWLSNDEVMALAPKDAMGALFTDKRIKKLSVEQSIFVRAFKNRYVQNMPLDDRGKCEATRKSFRKCSRRKELRKAVRNCYWMIKQPRFIHCMDRSKTSKKILRLLSTCIRVWCSTTPCDKPIDMITKAGCDTVRDIPELPLFMERKMCPELKVEPILAS